VDIQRRGVVVGLASAMVAGCRDTNTPADAEGETTEAMCGIADEPDGGAVQAGPWEHPCAPIDGGPIDELIAWLAQAERDELFDGVVDRIAGGLDPAALVTGMYVSQVTLAYSHDEHARLVIPSAHLAGGFGTDHHELLALMWCLRRNHPDGTVSSICPTPQVEPDASDAALDRLRDAMNAWDGPAADAALAAALRGGQLPAVRDVMLEYGARTQAWIGHTMIEAAQAVRVLAQGKNRGAEPIFRALVGTMMRNAADSTVPYDANRVRLEMLQAGWADGDADEGATLELLAELRVANDEDAAATAARMLGEGVGPRAIWDATRLAAAELTLRFPWPVWIKFPIHAVTSNNALRLAYDWTCDDRLRRLLLLQAVAWLPIHREQAREYQPAEPAPGWEIDTLAASGDASASVGELLEAADQNRRTGVALALGWLRGGGDAEELRARTLELCVANTFEEHELKFPIAAFEEAEAASAPFRERLTAAALAYGSAPQNGVWADHADAVAALSRLD
jgi:hypothetical protein